jgi:CrcB protein
MDPDVDLRVPAQRRELAEHPVAVLGAVAVGGVLGAEARAGLAALGGSPGGGFPVTTLVVNVSGCLLIGVLMTLLADPRRPHPLLRPLLGVGVLGGYTTFSGYAVDAQRLFADGHPATGAAALLTTPVLALTAVWLAAAVTRRVTR